MERRDDPAYDFNEPLLERALAAPPYNAGDVILAMAFVLPGRHAGEGGDVAPIVARAPAQSDPAPAEPRGRAQWEPEPPAPAPRFRGFIPLASTPLA